jgi:hypothetical protein
MAILLEHTTGNAIYLSSLHLFGRDASHANTLLNNTNASQIHASIRWNGAHWELLDHSRYGTLVQEQAIPSFTRVALEKGQIIRFGPHAEQSFLILNLDPPSPMLIPIQHQAEPIALHTIHLLPNEQVPAVSIYENEHGQWVWEDEQHSKILQGNELLSVAGVWWRFISPRTVEATLEINTLALAPPPSAHFKFLVSQNEEHIRLKISLQDQQISLGERSHHYCMLILARQRLADAQLGYDPLSQGWLSIARCATMLGVDEKHLNMLLHRARGQIAKAFANQALHSLCIERRRGEVRFGNFRFQIIRGMQLEAEFDPSLDNSSLQNAH